MNVKLFIFAKSITAVVLCWYIDQLYMLYIDIWATYNLS